MRKTTRDLSEDKQKRRLTRKVSITALLAFTLAAACLSSPVFSTTIAHNEKQTQSIRRAAFHRKGRTFVHFPVMATASTTFAPQPQRFTTSAPIPLNRSASFSPSLLVNANKLLSDRPQLIDCPKCKQHGHTELKYVSGLFTWVSFLVILVLGIFILPLFFLWVPFFVETFKDVEHRCPNCKVHIGTFRRLGK